MPVKNIFLSKRVGWIIFVALLFADAFIDMIRGVEGNPLWVPLVNLIGINYVPILVPLILPLYYFALKLLSRVVTRVDKVPHAEEILLTSLVVIYSVFDLWLVASGFFGFRLIRSFYQTIPVLIVAGFAYALLAEHLVKKN